MTVTQITSKVQFDALRASNKVFFVDFYTTWCSPCKAISPVFERLAREHAKDGTVEFYKLDIDQVREVAEELQITSIPTFYGYKGAERFNSLRGANPAELTTFVQTVPPAQ